MRRTRRGFTLLEVMVALALMGLALVVLIKSAASNIFAAEEAHMMGIVTDLARGKMYDIEEKLMKEGFETTDQSECDKDFSDEGFPNIKYCATVEPPEMPDLTALQDAITGKAQAAGVGSGSGFGSGGLANSGLAAMVGMLAGGTGGADILGQQAGGLLQMMYPIFQKILNDSIRKVTLKVSYKVLGHDRDITVVAYYTDPSKIDDALNGMGAIDLDDLLNGSNPPTGNPPASNPPKAPGRTK